ncbi:MAG: hypothetical protein ACK5PB_23170, partial [Pirellula sp.]
MSKTVAVLVASIFVVGGMLVWLAKNDRRPNSQPLRSEGAKTVADDSTSGSVESDITVLCAASNQTVIDLIRKEYEKET